MKLATQLAKEFSVPFAVALLWTAWQLWPRFDLKAAIAYFGPSFFLASWAISQVFRVKKQQKVERDLSDLLEKTKDASTAIHERAGQVLDYMSGGESYAYLDLQIYRQDDGSFKPQGTLYHVGSIDPMYNVEVWITDNQRDPRSPAPYGWEHKTDLLLPLTAERVAWDLIVHSSQARVDLSVAVRARNRPTRQRIVALLIGDKWTVATKVETVGYARNWDLRVQVPRDFPTLLDGSPDWSYERPCA